MSMLNLLQYVRLFLRLCLRCSVEHDYLHKQLQISHLPGNLAAIK